MADVSDRPNRVPWPPLLLLGAIGLGVGLNHLAPAALLRDPAVRIFGFVLVAAAVGLDAAAILTLVRHKTAVLPHRGAAVLVTAGPFAISRNPIYIGNILLTAGLAFALANAWLLASGPIEALLLWRLAVIPEERHLDARFGEAWRRYCRRTSRWLGVHRRGR